MRAIYTCAIQKNARKDDPANVQVEADVDQPICDILELAQKQHKVKVVEVIDERRLPPGPNDKGDDDGGEDEQENE